MLLVIIIHRFRCVPAAQPTRPGASVNLFLARCGVRGLIRREGRNSSSVWKSFPSNDEAFPTLPHYFHRVFGVNPRRCSWSGWRVACFAFAQGRKRQTSLARTGILSCCGTLRVLRSSFRSGEAEPSPDTCITESCVNAVLNEIPRPGGRSTRCDY